MIFAVQTGDPPRPTYFLLVFGVLSFAFVSVIRWFLYGPSKPDPWDEQTASDLREGNCTPICHRCLNPHDLSVNFCPECGAPVGKYTNLLPFLYPFSIGHTLRIGTFGRFKQSPLTVIGFIVLAFAEYSLIAPFYWVRLFLNMFDRTPADPVDNVHDVGSQDP